MDYGIIVDIYSPFGFIIFELRDKFKRPLDPAKQGFITIFNLAKETVMSRAKGSIKTLKTPTSEYYSAFGK